MIVLKKEKIKCFFHTLNPKCYMTMLQKQKTESEFLAELHLLI